MRRGQRLFPWISLPLGFPEVSQPTPGSNRCPPQRAVLTHPSLPLLPASSLGIPRVSSGQRQWKMVSMRLWPGERRPVPKTRGWKGGLDRDLMDGEDTDY